MAKALKLIIEWISLTVDSWFLWLTRYAFKYYFMNNCMWKYINCPYWMTFIEYMLIFVWIMFQPVPWDFVFNPFMPTVPTFAVRETGVSRHNGGASGAPIMPRDVSLSDSKWVKNKRCSCATWTLVVRLFWPRFWANHDTLSKKLVTAFLVHLQYFHTRYFF